MQGRRSVGLAAGLATIALVVAGFVASLASGAGAAPTIVPGTYTITVLGGSGNLHLQHMKIGPGCSNGSDDDLDDLVDSTGGTGSDGLPKAADPQCANAEDHDEGTPNTPYVNPTFEVDVDSAGNITAAAADITWQPSPGRQHGGPLGIVNATIRFMSDDVGGRSVTGTLDPATGRIDLEWRWHLETSAALPLVGPITVRIGTASSPLTTVLSTETAGGMRLDPLTLTTTLANDTMTVPAAACGGNSIACGQARTEANRQLGLPAEAGESTLSVLAAIDRNPIQQDSGGAPDLAVTKSHTGDFTAGVDGSYLLSVTNAGAGVTNGAVTLTETPPSGMTVVSMSGSGWTCAALTCTHAGPVGPGASLPDVTVTANVAAAGETTNTAQVATSGDTNAANDSATDATTVQEPAPGAPDLAVTKSHAGDFTVGVSGTYTVVVHNAGTMEATGPFTVTDTVPAALGPATAGGDGWACTDVLGSVSCVHPGPLAAGSSLPAIVLGVTPGSAGDVVNTVSLSAVEGDPNQANDTASDPTHVAAAVPEEAPDLRLDKSHTGTGFTTGVTGEWIVVVSNEGAGPTTGAVTVTDTLPSGVTYESASGDGWTCSHATGTVTCSRSDVMGVGAAAPEITIGVVAAAAGEVTNQATVATAGDADNLDDGDQDTVEVVDPPDLTVSVAAQGTFTVGQNAAFVMTVANEGAGSTSGDIVAELALPATLDFVGSTGDGWTCAAQGGGVDCSNPGPLLGGESLPAVQVVVRPNAAGDAAVSATVSTAGDENSENDTHLVTTQVQAASGDPVQPPNDDTNPGDGNSLPVTGAEIARLVLTALASLAVGLGLVGAASNRRRRSRGSGAS